MVYVIIYQEINNNQLFISFISIFLIENINENKLNL
jgi:hypothetical protein